MSEETRIGMNRVMARLLLVDLLGSASAAAHCNADMDGKPCLKCLRELREAVALVQARQAEEMAQR